MTFAANVDYSSKHRKLVTELTLHTAFTTVNRVNAARRGGGRRRPGGLAASREAVVTQTARAPSRRDRLRAATTEEIIQTARRLLVASGPEAVSLRAIAREMGMTAPGLYRYFGSYEELIRHVCASIFTELGADIDRAIKSAEPPPSDAPGAVTLKLTLMMAAACREFRRWALNHRSEFAMLFGVPLPGLDDGRYDIADECALAFAGTFFALFRELWQKPPFPVPADEQIDAGLRDQLGHYRDGLAASIPGGGSLPLGA